ncbi:DUF6310 domain-containing protein, partial [Corallococcus sp. AB045]|uniref:DUF6310 domain-containing protein n=1 Tax=Corallococcus sp. AB045 TaxID=2316719 RepID=UPI003510FCF1
EARRGEARRGEARRGEARRGEARRGEARRGEARRGEARRGEAKLARECGYDFVIGVRSEAHLTALKLADPSLHVVIID